jgi:type VI secretion system protein ImpJ
MSQYLEINWAEGMFLRPHHLQQASRSHKAIANEEISIARPYAWGVHEIDISEAELESNVISIRSCSIRMKDGTRIVAPDNAEFEPRDFKKALDAANGSLDVFIGLPLRMDREPNTKMLYEDEVMHERRYRASMLDYVDENTGDNSQQIEVRRLNPKILFANEEMAGYEIMKLIKIVRSGFDDNKPVISPEFIPPALDMAAWPPLYDAVRDIYHQLFAKNRSLISQIAGRKIAFGSEGVGGPEAMLKLNITNRYVAFLRQFTGTPRLHPFDVFVELCRFAGDLAIFDSSRMMPDLPLYDHDDLGQSYSQLLAILEKFINNLLPTTFIRRRFEPVGNRLEVALEDTWLIPGVEFYLGIESDHDVEVIDREQSYLKMASPEDLDRLINRRLPGLMGRRVHRTPIGLPDRQNIHYFRVRREGEYWDNVLKTKILGCYGLNDTSLELYLYVLLKPAEEGSGS